MRAFFGTSWTATVIEGRRCGVAEVEPAPLPRCSFARSLNQRPLAQSTPSLSLNALSLNQRTHGSLDANERSRVRACRANAALAEARVKLHVTRRPIPSDIVRLDVDVSLMKASPLATFTTNSSDRVRVRRAGLPLCHR